jgi:hypothetical protein
MQYPDRRSTGRIGRRTAGPLRTCANLSPQKYVVINGEFEPAAFAIGEGTRTLEYLTRLARRRPS